MIKPYALIADVHLHSWSTFSASGPNGTNSRLQGLLNEIQRAADTVKSLGGSTLVVAGDLFHVRGQIAPSVLNPTLDLFRSLVQGGMHVVIIPGNHDLEGKNSERLNSAVTALEGIGCKVASSTYEMTAGNDGADAVVIPWFEKLDDLRAEIASVKTELGDKVGEYDLILHAPINGVIKGIPDTGLEPAELADYGFKRVFAGHYHNHVEFPPHNVYSIGALAHHTFSDVGARAGFVIVGERLPEVQHYDSELPKFVDIAAGVTAADLPSLVKGNFARVKVSTTKVAEIEKLREFMVKAGALGVTIINVKQPTEERTAGVTVQAGASIETSVSEFVAKLTLEEGIDRAAVHQESLKVLAEAEIA